MVVKRIFQGLAVVWLTGVVLVGAGGYWVSNNVDTVAEAAVEATGIDKEIARKRNEGCLRSREHYHRMWDRAVESNRFDQMEDQLRQAEIGVEVNCEDV